jgi:hypothetical protein
MRLTSNPGLRFAGPGLISERRSAARLGVFSQLPGYTVPDALHCHSAALFPLPAEQQNRQMALEKGTDNQAPITSEVKS